MEEWKEYKLGDVCKIVGRIGFRGYTTDDLTNNPKEGAITLSPTNIVLGEIELSKPTYIKWPKYYESPEIMLNPGDIVLVKTGSSIGRTAYIRRIDHPMTLNPQFVVLKNIIVNPIFLAYIIKTPYFQALLKSITVGSAIPTLSQKNLGNLKIRIPNEDYQSRIASILKSLDDKIEVNRRINENLEQQAQALFKSWFVDFEPFKDGEFVESELGMIPKGWRVKCIGDLPLLVTDYVANGSFASLKENVKLYQEEEYAVFIRNTDLKSREFGVFVDKHSYDFLSKSRLYGGEVIISNVGDVGSVYLCPHLNRPMTLGNNIIMVKADDNIINTYLFILFKWSYGQGLIQSITGGSAQPKFNKTDFKSLKFIIPSNSVLDNYGVKLMTMMSIIEANNEENTRLAELRDTLLPKLMSGEIKVLHTDLINEMLEKGIR